MTDAPHGSPHDPEAADLFRRLADGELDLESPEVRAWSAKHPLAAEEIRTLLALDTELHASRIPVDRALAASPEPWPGADADVAAAVLQHLGRGPRSMPRRRWWPFALVGAAALLLVFLYLSRTGLGEGSEWNRPIPAEPDQLLGSQLWPRDTVSRQDLATRGFDWSKLPDLPATTTFAVEIHAADGRVWKSGPLTRRTWIPPPEVLAELPTDLKWHLHATSAGRSLPPWTTAVALR